MSPTIAAHLTPSNPSALIRRSFAILLICVVLQTEKSGLPSTELLRKPGYGICQVVATLAILPVTIYVIRKNLADLREQAREHLDQLADDKDDETVVKNPLTDGGLDLGAWIDS